MMKKLLLPITWAIILIMVSCNSKKSEIIAIDILLTLPDKMYAQAIHLNQLMLSDYPESIKLDENHIPHITLLQCFVDKNDITRIGESLEGLFSMVKNETLAAQEFVYSQDSEESFAMIRIENTEALLNIHQKTIEILKPFMVKHGTSASFIQNPDGSPINEFTLAYVPRFVESYSHENFDPHISLGVAKTKFLSILATSVFQPTTFQPRNLSVYWLGDSGTAQKLLWEEKQ
ncbi:MAG TPA: hypothetical protein VKX40_00850 [Aequorivita sp.]|nr:hypothetical protein [Aequorivita sp.]